VEVTLGPNDNLAEGPAPPADNSDFWEEPNV